MASSAKDQRLLYLVAAAITVIAAGFLIANVQDASGLGVKISNETLEQITDVLVQLMVVFWIALIGYFVYRYFTTKKGGRIKGEHQSGEGNNMLPYALVLLALWLILFGVNPGNASGLFGGAESSGSTGAANTTQQIEQPTRDLPLVFPMIVVVIAIASIVIVWRFLRKSNGPPVHISILTADEEAKAVLDAAMRSLYAGEDPRSTIIRTYQQMCMLIQVGKLDEEPYLTPREFAERAENDLGWRKGPLGDLTLLFEEARYSSHAMGEGEKDRAISALERVREGLGGAPPAGPAQ